MYELKDSYFFLADTTVLIAAGAIAAAGIGAALYWRSKKRKSSE